MSSSALVTFEVVKALLRQIKAGRKVVLETAGVNTEAVRLATLSEADIVEGRCVTI